MCHMTHSCVHKPTVQPVASCSLVLDIEEVTLLLGQRSKLGFYVPFNSQGDIGTGPQNCHLWDSNPQR